MYDNAPLESTIGSHDDTTATVRQASGKNGVSMVKSTVANVFCGVNNSKSDENSNRRDRERVLMLAYCHRET